MMTGAQICIKTCLYDTVYHLQNGFGVPTQGIELAIRALHEASAREQLQQQHSNSAKTRRLVIAGGYDVRLAENREYYEELESLVQQLGLSDRV